MEDASDLNLGDIFTKPPSPPPPEPTYAHYSRPLTEPHRHESDWERLSIRLVGSHPLWGHHLWNAARCFATYLDQNANRLCVGKDVLELGAGGGLPSFVAALCGARRVLLTDYPDKELIENIKINAIANIPSTIRDNVQVQGYIWGRPVTELLSGEGCTPRKFDLILMSDLVFNHSQHVALLQTAESCLSQKPTNLDSSSIETPCVLVFYTHHRPHLAERDLGFFVKARERGWTCEEIVTERFQPMFSEDSGDETVRSEVHGWIMTRNRSG